MEGGIGFGDWVMGWGWRWDGIGRVTEGVGNGGWGTIQSEGEMG